MKILLMGIITFAKLSAAVPVVCVRNFEKTSLCEKKPDLYVRLMSYSTPKKKVCARAVTPLFCEMAPDEHAWVKALDEKERCVVNYDQPGIADFCDSLPLHYDWVVRLTLS